MAALQSMLHQLPCDATGVAGILWLCRSTRFKKISRFNGEAA
jgi:hypothetical protein